MVDEPPTQLLYGNHPAGTMESPGSVNAAAPRTDRRRLGRV